MMRITTPGNVFPHRLFKRIQRLQEKAEKKTGKEPGWNEKLEKDMKQVEEQLRNGFSGPTQHCYGFGPRGRGGMNRGPWSGAAGTPWNSAAGTAWNAAAPTWNAMMRGWMGEQPACRSQDKKDDEKKKDEKHEKTHEEAVKAAQEASKEAHEQAHSAAQAAAASAAFSFPTMTGSADYLQNVGSFVAAALDPLGIDVKIDIETPEGRKSCHVSRQASTASASTSAGQEQDKEETEKEKVLPRVQAGVNCLRLNLGRTGTGQGGEREGERKGGVEGGGEGRGEEGGGEGEGGCHQRREEGGLRAR